MFRARSFPIQSLLLQRSIIPACAGSKRISASAGHRAARARRPDRACAGRYRRRIDSATVYRFAQFEAAVMAQ
jgi:hypothetical protein